MTRSLAVVKVGGSLYDLPDLGPRLTEWISTRLRQAPGSDTILAPGGGSTANVIRDFDRVHRLGEERAHWLALEALRLNAYLLRMLLPMVGVLEDVEKIDRSTAGPDSETLISSHYILDCHSFAVQDERRRPKAALPHLWAVTSDSIAARAAVVAGADHLVLLKSVTIPEGMDWEEAAARGFVDEWFARTIRPALPRLQVRAVNFREWTP